MVWFENKPLFLLCQKECYLKVEVKTPDTVCTLSDNQRALNWALTHTLNGALFQMCLAVQPSYLIICMTKSHLSSSLPCWWTTHFHLCLREGYSLSLETIFCLCSWSNPSPYSFLVTCQLGWNLSVLNTCVLVRGKKKNKIQSTTTNNTQNPKQTQKPKPRMFCLHVTTYFSSISEPLMYSLNVRNMEKTLLGWPSYRSHPFWKCFLSLPGFLVSRAGQRFLRSNHQQEYWLKRSVPVKQLTSWRTGIDVVSLTHFQNNSASNSTDSWTALF